MISKKVQRSEPGRFKYLAEYLAAARDDDEKLDSFWMVNCLAGESLDDLDLAIHEIEATQAQNTRARGNKTYHLIVSFQQGEALPEDDLRNIEREFAKVLGFTGHQRAVATHKNTDNFHLHVAYNMIHPATLKILHPSNDYYKRDALCRQLEKKHGLKVDFGHDKWDGWRDPEDKHLQRPQKGSERAKDMEACRWEQSFESFVLEQKETLLGGIKTAKNWQDVHEVFEAQGLTLKERGAGLVIAQGKHHMKASTVHRNCSKNTLEKRFGKFKAKRRTRAKALSSGKKYGVNPIYKLRGVAQKVLWEKFLARKRKQATLSWREYLLMMEGFDPLAQALIRIHKRTLGILDKEPPPLQSASKPPEKSQDFER